MHSPGQIRIFSSIGPLLTHLLGVGLIRSLEEATATLPIECQDVRRHTVEEVTVVTDHHPATRKSLQCLLEQSKSRNVEVVGRFVEDHQVSTTP